jgi:hypothetical protein
LGKCAESHIWVKYNRVFPVCPTKQKIVTQTPQL